MSRESDVLRRYESQLADRMKALQGIAEAVGNGALGPLSHEQRRAVDLMDRSARRLWSALSDLKHGTGPGPERTTRHAAHR